MIGSDRPSDAILQLGPTGDGCVLWIGDLLAMREPSVTQQENDHREHPQEELGASLNGASDHF